MIEFWTVVGLKDKYIQVYTVVATVVVAIDHIFVLHCF